MGDRILLFAILSILTTLYVSEIAGDAGDEIWSQDNPGKKRLGGCKWKGNSKWGSLKSVSDPAGGPNKVWQIFYPKGSIVSNSKNKGGVSKCLPFGKSDEVTVQYSLMFESGFKFAKGGKMFGLYGGSGTCAGGKESKNCFSCRLMWRDNGIGQLYCYIPNHDFEATNMCDGDLVNCHDKYGESIGRGYWTFTPGVWQCIGLYVKLNEIGQSNGVLKVFVDGEVKVTLTGLKIRSSSKLLINNLYCASFFGGNKKEWQAPMNCRSFVKNLRIFEGEVTPTCEEVAPSPVIANPAPATGSIAATPTQQTSRRRRRRRRRMANTVGTTTTGTTTPTRRRRTSSRRRRRRR